MHNSKLIHLFRALTKKELFLLNTFLKSPLYSKSSKALQLYELIKKEHPKYKGKALKKENIYKHLFPKQPYKDSNLRMQMSNLAKLIERFFIFLEAEKDKQHQNRLLQQAYYHRNLPKYFNQQLQYNQQQLAAETEKGVEHYYWQYLLQEDAYLVEMVSKSRSKAAAMQETLNSFDTYYLASKLRYCCAILNRSHILATQNQLFMLEDLLKNVANSPYLEVSLIRYYYHAVLLLLEKEEEQHFQYLAQSLPTESGLSTFDLRQIYTLLVNYCSRKIKAGKSSYYNQLFDLYKNMLAKNLLYADNYISPNHFGNIVAVGLQLNQSSWVEKFINTHASAIHPNFRAHTIPYNWAIFYFHQKKYNETLQQLLSVTFNDAFSHILYKKLLLKTYYELSETEALEALIQSFRQLLKRNEQISESNQTAYRNFVNYSSRIYRLKISINKIAIESLENLQMQLENLRLISDKQWLLQKINELKVTS